MNKEKKDWILSIIDGSNVSSRYVLGTDEQVEGKMPDLINSYSETIGARPKRISEVFKLVDANDQPCEFFAFVSYAGFSIKYMAQKLDFLGREEL